MSTLATLLLQLLCVGMMIVSTYETVMHGRNGSVKRTKRYANFEENMRNDLIWFLDKGGENKNLVNEIGDYMSYEYGWLENFVVVYNDVWGFDEHTFDGQRVDSLHRNGKCGIVFYRMKDEPPEFSSRIRTARLIVESVRNDDVYKAYQNIVARMGEKNIGWTGVAVVKRWVDLWYSDRFTTEHVFVFDTKHTRILLLQ